MTTDVCQIAIAGEHGRMALSLQEQADLTPGFHLVGTIGRHHKDPKSVLSQAQVLIDFTTPQALEQLLPLARDFKVPYVVATTALEPHHHILIQEASHHIPIFQGANLSVGIALLKKALEVVAPAMRHGTCHLTDVHHVHKKDAPSGTALELQRHVAQLQGKPLDQVPLSSLRLGEVPGDHEVIFAHGYEVLTLGHRAVDRRVFAQNALHIGAWLKDQAPGLYHMEDYVRDL